MGIVGKRKSPQTWPVMRPIVDLAGDNPREAALTQLHHFIQSGALDAYAQKRNFDDCHHVSVLSPYIRHGLLRETEILQAVLAQGSYAQYEKFIQEVFWRNYWKGWLQMRPGIWADYRSEVDRADPTNPDYLTAIEGHTGIACFDHWVAQLKETGYLHNHARMWFASIWIFTLQLPWALGAAFFYRHLYDGDAAANTLSWRWVAGLQTIGKTYLARADNIEKFTNGRFRPNHLAQQAEPLSGPPHPDPRALQLNATCPEMPTNACVLLTDDDVVTDHLPQDYPRRYLSIDQNPISSSVLTFKNNMMGEEFKNDFDVVITSHTPIGYAHDRLCALEAQGLRVIRVARDYDRLCWPHAKKGFFAFKKHIPEIIAALRLGDRTA